MLTTAILELLSDIGEHAKGPIVLFLDSNTAINLAHAPFVTKKSRHIEKGIITTCVI